MNTRNTRIRYTRIASSLITVAIVLMGTVSVAPHNQPRQTANQLEVQLEEVRTQATSQNGTIHPIWKQTWGEENYRGAHDQTIVNNTIFVTGLTSDNQIYLSKLDLSGNILWSKKYLVYPTVYYSEQKMATDGSYIYITGFTNIFNVSNYDVFLLKLDLDGTLIWNVTWDSGDGDISKELLVYSGSIYVIGFATNATGSFGNVLKFDSSGAHVWTKQLVLPMGAIPEDIDVFGGYFYISGVEAPGHIFASLFLQKYTFNWNLVWTKKWSPSTQDECVVNTEMTIYNGSIYVCGSVEGSGDRYIFLQQYDLDGNLRGTRAWNRALPNNARGSDTASGVVVTPMGVYITGTSQSNHGYQILLLYCDFDDIFGWWYRVWEWGEGVWERDRGAAIVAHSNFLYLTGGTSLGASLYAANPVVLKYNLTGSQIWAKLWGTGDNDYGVGAVTIGNSLYVLGQTSSYGRTTLDVVILKYDIAGNLIWTKYWGTDRNNDIPVDISTDGSYLFITGVTKLTHTKLNENLFSDIFLLKLDLNGSLVWEKKWGTNDTDFVYGLAVYSGFIYVTGSTTNYTVAGFIDCGFMLIFDCSGNFVSQIKLHPIGEAYPTAIVVAQNFVYLTGVLSRSGGFGPYHAFLAKYDLNGNLLWCREWGGTYGWMTAGEIPNDILFYSTEIYITGSSSGSQEASPDFLFITKFESDGTQVWYRKFDSGSSQLICGGVKLINSGSRLYLGGHLGHNRDDVVKDIDILMFDSNGNIIWGKNWSSPNTPLGDITADSNHFYFVVTINYTSYVSQTNGDILVFQTTLMGTGLPTEPRHPVASPGDGKIELSWLPPLSDGGTPITNYRIYRGTRQGGETFLVEVGNATSYVDTGLMNGVTYYYRVSAKNSVGEGPLSIEVSATPTSIGDVKPVVTILVIIFLFFLSRTKTSKKRGKGFRLR